MYIYIYTTMRDNLYNYGSRMEYFQRQMKQYRYHTRPAMALSVLYSHRHHQTYGVLRPCAFGRKSGELSKLKKLKVAGGDHDT